MSYLPSFFVYQNIFINLHQKMKFDNSKTKSSNYIEKKVLPFCLDVIPELPHLEDKCLKDEEMNKKINSRKIRKNSRYSQRNNKHNFGLPWPHGISFSFNK